MLLGGPAGREWPSVSIGVLGQELLCCRASHVGEWGSRGWLILGNPGNEERPAFKQSVHPHVGVSAQHRDSSQS